MTDQKENLTCLLCQQEIQDDKPLLLKAGGKTYRRRWCQACNTKRTNRWHASEAGKVSLKRELERKRVSRSEGKDTERWILEDIRASDRKRGFTTDLTKEGIAEIIKPGCSYCGETGIRMTLDRLDNTKGHTMDNVVAACIRCNLTRGDMPIKAWLVVAEAMRKAREQGLFGDWDRKIRRKIRK